MAPALTARKFGITPKIRFGCCLEGATDLLAVSAAAIDPAAVGDSVFGNDALSAAGDRGCSVAEDSALGGVVCWADSEETKLTPSKQTMILAENLIDKCPPVRMHLTSSTATIS